MKCMYHLEKIFNYNQKEVRVVAINDSPWFVAKDVCEILEHSDSRKAVARLDTDEKLVGTIFLSGQNRETWLINEAGLYSLILTSRKPEAKSFKRWITHEVIPSLRVHGQYSIHNNQQYNLPMTYRDALVCLLSEVERNEQLQLLNEKQQSQLTEQKPKVEMYETFMSADGTQSMSQVAKILGWGRNRLYSFLREKGVLNDSKAPHKRNLPHQPYIDLNYFKVINAPMREGDIIKITNQVLVYPKGVEFITRMLKQHELEQQYIQYYKESEEGVYYK